MIEPGRCNQTATDRNCPFCGSNQIEDEVDFLFDCCKYSLIIGIILINELMNSSDYLYQYTDFMKFISACFDFRDEFLTKYSLILLWLNFKFLFLKYDYK